MNLSSLKYKNELNLNLKALKKMNIDRVETNQIKTNLKDKKTQKNCNHRIRVMTFAQTSTTHHFFENVII